MSYLEFVKLQTLPRDLPLVPLAGSPTSVSSSREMVTEKISTFHLEILAIFLMMVRQVQSEVCE